MAEYTSVSQGNLNTVLGAIGTVGAVGSAVLPGLFGAKGITPMGMGGPAYLGYGMGYGYGHPDGMGCPINRYELEAEKAAERERTDDKMRIARLEAEKYSDHSDIEVYKQLRSEIKELGEKNAQAHRELYGEIQRVEAKGDCRNAAISEKLGEQAVFNQATRDGVAMARQELDAAIKLEAERRCCADNKIILYANSTFRPKLFAPVTTTTEGTAGTTAVELTSTTPTPACTYNPLLDGCRNC